MQLMSTDPDRDANVQIYHDYFAIRGGGERLILELANQLPARLIYGYRTEHTYPISSFPEARQDLGLSAFSRLGPSASLALAAAFSGQRRSALQGDVRIFSGVVAPFAAPNSGQGLNLFYCHTPPRFLYDQKEFYWRGSGTIRRLGLTVMGPVFKRGYERAVGRMDIIVANSINIQDRIRRYLGRESSVVYPPVDVHSQHWEPDQGYYLSTARLTALKRIDLIIDAFRQMPHRRLIVASGGEQETALRARAAGAPNISFAGWVSEDRLRQLVSGSIATVYVPVEEDFGMSPVESMAAGKPVIGVAEGGLIETIVPGQTGILTPRRPSVAELVAAVADLPPERALSMRSACEAQAQKFTTERFIQNMRQVIDTALAAKAGKA
jgi:glycosyltransferase involved in cell wall biosynthesis